MKPFALRSSRPVEGRLYATDPLPPGRRGLIELFEAWDALGVPISESEVRRGLERLRLDREAVREGVRFGVRTYQRNLIRRMPHYEALILCWRSGQASPIHDHGESVGGVLIVEGVATETTYLADTAARRIHEHSQRLPAGSIAVSVGGDIHRVANHEGPPFDLISLHVYSPPLLSSRYFRIDRQRLHVEPAGSIAAPETHVSRP